MGTLDSGRTSEYTSGFDFHMLRYGCLLDLQQPSDAKQTSTIYNIICEVEDEQLALAAAAANIAAANIPDATR